MYDTFRLANEMSAAMSLNALLCYLKKIPLIGRLFRRFNYEHMGLKRNLAVIAVVIQVIKVLSNTIFAALLVIGLPMLIMSDSSMIEKEKLYWHMILAFYFIFNGLMNADILMPNRNKFIFIKVMRMNARDYIITNFLWIRFLKTVFGLLVFLFIGQLLHIPVPLTILFVVAINLFRCFGEAVHILFYERRGEFLSKTYALYYGYAFISLILGIVPVVLGKMISFNHVTLYIIFICLSLIGIIGFVILYRYQHYFLVLNEANKFSELSVSLDKIKREASFSDVKINTKKFSAEELRNNSFAEKNGYDYLNELFFKRHRKIVILPMLYELGIIAIMLVGGIAATYFMKDFKTQYTTMITNSFTVFVFIMYMVSTAGKMTKAMFYNCDISLLRYGFYKKEKSVLTMFSLRLNKLAYYNIFPAFCLGITLIIIGLFCDVSIRLTLPVAIFVVVLSLFFTIHHLFLYYILQPYTTDLEVKSPVFRIVNVITYILCYSCLQIDATPVWFLSAVLGATVVYIIIALLLVYRYAPKTFVVK